MSTQQPNLDPLCIQDEDILGLMGDQSEDRAPEGDLVVPPLSQSKQGLLACNHLYASNKEGSRDSVPSIRGREVHDFMASYVRHLAETKRATDFDWFDAEAATSAFIDTDAHEIILPNLRETVIDPDEVLHIEDRLYLDENFNPMPGLSSGMTPDEAARAGVHYDGKPDLVFLRGARSIVKDYKTQFKITNALTYQGKQYAALILLHYSFVQEVEFELHFVRYGAVRSVIYTREQLPMLKQAMASARKKQLDLEAILQAGVSGSALAAMPGPHCVYCPKLHSGCPIQANEFAQTPEEALVNIVWAQQFLGRNKAVLVPAINLRGFVQIEDGNGNKREARYAQRNKSAYFLEATIPVIKDYIVESGEDISGKLKIGATELNSLAKAQKRAGLRKSLDAVKVVTKETVLRISGLEDEGEE